MKNKIIDLHFSSVLFNSAAARHNDDELINNAYHLLFTKAVAIIKDEGANLLENTQLFTVCGEVESPDISIITNFVAGSDLGSALDSALERIRNLVLMEQALFEAGVSIFVPNQCLHGAGCSCHNSLAIEPAASLRTSVHNVAVLNRKPA